MGGVNQAEIDDNHRQISWVRHVKTISLPLTLSNRDKSDGTSRGDLIHPRSMLTRDLNTAISIKCPIKRLYGKFLHFSVSPSHFRLKSFLPLMIPHAGLFSAHADNGLIL